MASGANWPADLDFRYSFRRSLLGFRGRLTLDLRVRWR
jgi:hypothetical protein